MSVRTSRTPRPSPKPRPEPPPPAADAVITTRVIAQREAAARRARGVIDTRGIPRAVVDHAARVLAWNRPSTCPARCSPGDVCPLGAGHALPHQQVSAGAPWGPELLMLLAGRASGKTRSAAEWVSTMLLGYPNPGSGRPERHDIILVGPTFRDVGRVMLQGPSGVLSVLPDGIVTDYNKSDLVAETIYGTRIMGFSTSAIERVRGSEGGSCWWDEAGYATGAHLSPWHPASPYSTVRNALRLGPTQRIRMTSTPRPVPLMKDLMAAEGTVSMQASSLDNLYLPDGYRRMAREAIDSGSALGRQEFAGELLAEIAGSAWTGTLLALVRADVDEPPTMSKRLIAVDPNAVGGEGNDEVGILTGGLSDTGHAWVTADDTTQAGPERWPALVAEVALREGVDLIAMEVDNGGSMPRLLVRSALDAIGLTRVNVVDRRATKRKRDDVTRGLSGGAKWSRALFSAGYYGTLGGTEEAPTLIGGKVRQLAGLYALEAEQTTFTADAKWSPNRLDALSLLLRELLGKPGSGSNYSPPPDVSIPR